MSLEFKNVTVEYPLSTKEGGSLRALDHLNLRVESGEALAIIGPSGCGKSTLLRLASGLMQPTEGTVLVDDAALARPREETALILQDFGLLPWKTVYQNAELGLRIHGVNRAQRKDRTMAALQQVGLADFAAQYPRELSGGMQQRLALARAIAQDTTMLLMDEPLSALDALLRESLQDTLLDLWNSRHHTQVLVTHSIEEAVYLGQRIVVMAPRPGRVVTVIENPEMGTHEYRDAELFYERCHAVRAALTSGSITQVENATDENESAGE